MTPGDARNVVEAVLVSVRDTPRLGEAWEEIPYDLRKTLVEKMVAQVLEVPFPHWEDQPDEYSKSIDAAKPTRTGRHDRYALALELVGNRHGKYALVDLVNWLLAARDEEAAARILQRDLTDLKKKVTSVLNRSQRECPCKERSHPCVACVEVARIIGALTGDLR